MIDDNTASLAGRDADEHVLPAALLAVRDTLLLETLPLSHDAPVRPRCATASARETLKRENRHVAPLAQRRNAWDADGSAEPSNR